MIHQYVRVLLVLWMLAAVCGIVSAVSIGAESHETSGVSAPACTAPCECISLTDAMHRWGTDGYDYCSKTVCGQSADAMTQYYCLHQAASTASAAPAAQAPAPAAAAPAAGVTQKSPAGSAAIIAAIGAALLASAAMRRK